MVRPLLPSANEVAESNVFTPVCQSFCSQGGMHGRGCVAGGHSWQGACMVGGMCGGDMCGRGASLAGEMATAADSTHATGMLSCLI